MKTKLFVVLLFPIFGFISTETKAQIKTNPKFSWFNKNQQSNANWFGLRDTRSTSTFLSNKTTTPYPRILVLPLDNMLCLLPSNEIKYHIRIYNPHQLGDIFTYNMPNALSRRKLIE